MKKLVIFLIIASGCYSSDYSEGPVVSPSKKYYITVTVNRTNEKQENYAYVVINLYDINSKLLQTFNTGAGDLNKWAIDWMPEQDIIVMNSSDIGTYAWVIKDNINFKSIKVTKVIDDRANEIKIKKYKTR